MIRQIRKLIHTIVIIKAILAASYKHKHVQVEATPFHLRIFLDTRERSA